MNIERKYEMQKKHLEHMTEKVDRLQSALNKYEADEARAKELISELESMKRDWQEQINRLKNKRYEYDVLIAQLKTLRKGLFR